MSAELMRRAIALALENVRCARGGPFAALVAKDGKVIAEGANSVAATNDPTAHAEIVAIRAVCKTLGTFQLAGSDLYTTCEPCPMCLGAIYWARPRASFMLESPPTRRTRALTTRSFTKSCNARRNRAASP
jgi:guanine deaminase